MISARAAATPEGAASSPPVRRAPHLLCPLRRSRHHFLPLQGSCSFVVPSWCFLDFVMLSSCFHSAWMKVGALSRAFHGSIWGRMCFHGAFTVLRWRFHGVSWCFQGGFMSFHCIFTFARCGRRWTATSHALGRRTVSRHQASSKKTEGKRYNQLLPVQESRKQIPLCAKPGILAETADYT